MIIVANKSVDLSGLQPEGWEIIRIAEVVFDKYKLNTIVTAGVEEFNNEGKLIHMVGSYHSRGYAVDLRSSDIVSGIWTKFISDFRIALHAVSWAYQLVIEETHFHVEYDLKVAWSLAHAK